MRIIHLPDIHAGHVRLKTELLHEHFKRLVYPQLTKDMDLLVIGGDFFHTLLDLNSDDAFYANTIITELRELAEINDFYIRIIRGTFSHDRLQNRFFTKHIEKNNTRVRLFQTPDIEYIERFDIWVLYKPDDIPHDNIWESLVDLIKQQNINQVDLFINHGYFEHMFPDNIPKKPHGMLSRELVEPYVKGVILNGHIHLPSIRGKVINGGSLERHQFGEDEDRGFFIINYNPITGKVDYEFIKNPYTPLYLTYILEKNNIDDFNDWVRHLDIGETEELNIRVITDDPSIKPAVSQIARNVYPDVKLICRGVKREKYEYENINTVMRRDLVMLTENNLVEKLQQHIQEKFHQKMEADTIHSLLGAVS